MMGRREETMHTRDQLLAEADQLDAMAATNEAYMRAMERTTQRTNGRLGHLNASNTYAAHQMEAANKRKRATDLRAQAESTHA